MIDTERSIVRDTRSTGTHIVQAGWQLHGWGGELIGEVIDRDADSVVVRVGADGGARARVPIRLIAEEEESAQRATLAVEADQLESLQGSGYTREP